MRSSRGFTLVEVMMVVLIIGFIAALAIPSISKYVKQARTAEAYTQIEKLWVGSVAYYQADHADSTGAVTNKQFPGSTQVVVEAITCCEGTRGGICPGNDVVYQSPPDFQHPWVSLGFNLATPHRYAPRYYSRYQPVFPTAWVDIEIHGDLDCDTIESVFYLKGDVVDGEPKRRPVNVLNETE